MKILSFEYTDLRTGWKLEQIDFHDLTLLVGASGVGKTKILKALYHVKEMALGKSVDGVQWGIVFEEEGVKYRWSGKSEPAKEPLNMFTGDSSAGLENAKIVNEELVKHVGEAEAVIFSRTEDGILFADSKIPKVSPNKSCLDLFSEEEEIKPVKVAFNKLYFIHFEKESMLTLRDVKRVILRDATKATGDFALGVLRKHNAPMIVKLAVASVSFPDVFDEIKRNFIAIFPLVEDIRFSEVVRSVRDEERVDLELQIKEVDSDWISTDDISSGMLKTLLYLAMLYLVPKNSVILIDEFENSLGINCIDLLAVNVSGNQEIQFVMTSHHPYIINQISMQHWKVVSRQNGRVIAKDASEYGLGRSKHQAFKQLINLKVFTEGRE